jgi:hypothetical protein
MTLPAAARLRDSIRAVAALDPDWATESNGRGFSAADTRFGHALAEMPESRWTELTLRDAWELLRSVRVQLDGLGIDFSVIPEPPDYDEKYVTVPSARGPFRTTRGREQVRGFRKLSARGVIALMYLEGRHAMVDSAKDRQIIDALRGIPGARWLGNPALWKVEVRSKTVADGLIALAERFDMEVPAGFADALRQLGGDAVEAIHEPGIYLDETGHQILVRTGANSDAYSAVSKIPGASYDKKIDAFRVALTQVSWERLAPISEHCRVPIDPAMEARANEVFAVALRAYKMAVALEPQGFVTEAPGLRDDPPLDAAQWAGIEYIVEHHSGVGVFDEQGVAKTAETLAALAVLGRRRIIWVCPSTAKSKIRGEVLNRFPDWDARIVDGRGPKGADKVMHAFDPEGTSVVILNPEILKAHGTKLLNWWPDALVLDEGHRFKERKTSWTETAKELAERVRVKDGSVCVLTGTPEPNGPWELISLLEIMGRLDELGGSSYFQRHYCGGHWESVGRDKKAWVFDKKQAAATALELNRALRSTCMLRRRLADVLPDLICLPPEVIDVTPDPEVMAEYRRAEDDIASYMAERAANLARQLGLDPHSAGVRARLKAKMAEDAIELAVLRRLAGMAKIPAVCQWVTDWLELNQELTHAAIDGTEITKVGKIVVFGYHNDVVDSYRDRLGGVAIRGQDSRSSRDKARHAFQSDDGVRVIVCSIIAAGEAIELHAGSTNATTEFDWVPKTHWQAVSRQYRRGQTGPVRPVYFRADGTVDDAQVGVLNSKAVLSGTTIDGGEANTRMFEDVDVERDVYDRLIDIGMGNRKAA